MHEELRSVALNRPLPEVVDETATQASNEPALPIIEQEKSEALGGISPEELLAKAQIIDERREREIERTFNFSNTHKNLIACDAETAEHMFP